MFLDFGRKLEYPVITHPCTGRTCKLHAENPPTRSRNPGPSCCKATNCATVQLVFNPSSKNGKRMPCGYSKCPIKLTVWPRRTLIREEAGRPNGNSRGAAKSHSTDRRIC
ncbi:hypothetical protein ILYODFUR_032623 [Ilyodon furcidens]|uniref:Uncharacterized protein n=1 Tax=Ilyodon furcidens TaxID=33524 RepID=A0ABV0T2E8_9TELE